MTDYTYEDVEHIVEEMYDFFWEDDKAEFMLIAALSFVAEINEITGFSLKKINALFRQCEKDYLKNVFKNLEEK